MSSWEIGLAIVVYVLAVCYCFVILMDLVPRGERHFYVIYLSLLFCWFIVPIVIYDRLVDGSPKELRAIRLRNAEKRSAQMERELGEWK